LIQADRFRLYPLKVSWKGQRRDRQRAIHYTKPFQKDWELKATALKPSITDHHTGNVKG